MSYHRAKERAKRLKKLYEETHKCFCSGVYYDIEKNRYVRYYLCRRAKFYKKYSNHKVRKSKESLNHNQYRLWFNI